MACVHFVACFANDLWESLCSLLCFSVASFSLPSLDTQFKLRCLISHLLRTLSPLGDCGLTRHNISAGWPEKDPKQSRERGKETVEQREFNWCLRDGQKSRFQLQLLSWKHFPGWGQIWVSPRVCRRFVFVIFWYMHAYTHLPKVLVGNSPISKSFDSFVPCLYEGR